MSTKSIVSQPKKRAAAGRGIETKSTGIQTLDYVLGGGFRVFKGFYPGVVIRGQPGCGKTLLSARLSCEQARAGQSAIYVTLDQKANEVRTMIGEFEWAPRSGDIVEVNINAGENGQASPLDAEGAKLVLSHIPISLLRGLDCVSRQHRASPSLERNVSMAERLENLDAQLLKYLSNLRARVKHCGLIVVDALSDFLHEGLAADEECPYYVQRAMFQHLCELGRKWNSTIVCVLEKRSDRDWRDYVADVVIDLGWREEEGRIKRYLQVEKARYTPVVSGRHEMEIVPREGVVIVPSHLEFLRQEPIDRPRDRKILDFCGNAGLAEMLGEGPLEGSSSLLFGEDACRKNVAATRFLQQGLREADESGDPEARVLFVAVGLTEDVARHLLRRYLEQEADGEASVERRLKRIEIITSHEFCESRDAFFDRLRRKLDEHRIVRAAVDDLGAFRGGSEAALPIKELLALRGITSLFVHTVDHGKESEIRESFDTVIRARYVTLPNGLSQRIGYRVLKVNGATRGAVRSWELGYDEKTRELVVCDAFREFEEGNNGQLAAIPLRLMAHCEYSSLRDKWVQSVWAAFGVPFHTVPSGRAHDRALSIETVVREDAERFFQDLLLAVPSLDLGETQVVSFDEYWLDALLENRKLAELSRYFTDANGSLSDLDRPGAVGQGTTAPGLFGIPQYWNFGIYTLRTDIVTDKLLEKHKMNLTEPQPWSKWVEIASEAISESKPMRVSEGMATYHGQPEEVLKHCAPLRFFSFPKSFNEDLVCCVLEVLWPFLFRGKQGCGFDDEAVVEAFSKWCHYLGDEARKETNSLPPWRRFHEEPAVLERHWVVSYWSTLRQHGHLRQHMRIIPAPILGPKDSPELQAASISGDWFLGIMQGSPNPERGVRAIKTLTSSTMGQRMLDDEIGLPPHANLLLRDGLRELAGVHGNAVSRRRIKRYHEVRLLLLEAFEKILNNSRCTKQDIESILRELAQRVRAIQDQQPSTSSRIHCVSTPASDRTSKSARD